MCIDECVRACVCVCSWLGYVFACKGAQLRSYRKFPWFSVKGDDHTSVTLLKLIHCRVAGATGDM